MYRSRHSLRKRLSPLPSGSYPEVAAADPVVVRPIGPACSLLSYRRCTLVGNIWRKRVRWWVGMLLGGQRAAL